MKRLLVLLALCLPLYLFAQGFGSFSHDQPFFAKDVSTTSSTPLLPFTNYLKYWFVSTDLTVTNLGIPDWTDRITGITFGNSVTTARPTNINRGVYFQNLNNSQFISLTNTSIQIVTTTTNWCVLIVVSNINLRVQAPNNRGIFWNHHTTGQGFRLLTNSTTGIVSWALATSSSLINPDVILANYNPDIPKGIQAMLLISTNGSYWASYTNRILSANSVGAFAPVLDLYMLGRGASWPNTSSFEGYVYELAVWTNKIFTDQMINDAFDYVTNTYGHFGP